MSFPRIVKAALELQSLVRELGVPFCFIGGVAVQRWSEPRFTQDADATVLTRFVDDERVVDGLLAHLASRREDARREFSANPAHSARMCAAIGKARLAR